MQQQTIFSDPPSLPSPPALEHWLYEQPWVSAVLLGLVGVVACVVLFKAEKRRWAWLVLLIGIGLATANVLVAQFVETPREKLSRFTVQLIESVKRGDAITVDTMLADAVVLDLLGSRSGRKKADIVREVANGAAKRYGADTATIGRVSATMDGSFSGRTQAKVAVDLARGEGFDAGGLGTTWLLEWRADAAGNWRVWTIDAQQIGLFPQGSLRW